MTASQEKKQFKKMKIIDTAYSLFLKNSVNATAIDDVVKAAGIARGTFYLYFKDKSDLLEQIVMCKSMDSMKVLLAQTEKRLSGGEIDFVEMCRMFVENYIDFLVMHREILIVVRKNLSSCLKSIPNFSDDAFANTYNSVLNSFIAYGYDEDTAKKTMYLVIDMVGSVCSDAILYNSPFSIEQLRGTVISAAINIITNGKNVNSGALQPDTVAALL